MRSFTESREEALKAQWCMLVTLSQRRADAALTQPPVITKVTSTLRRTPLLNRMTTALHKQVLVIWISGWTLNHEVKPSPIDEQNSGS